MGRDFVTERYNNILYRRNSIMRTNYKSATLSVLSHYDEPKTSDIMNELCYGGSCPLDKCAYEEPGNIDCGHVLAVSILSSRVNNVLNGD